MGHGPASYGGVIVPDVRLEVLFDPFLTFDRKRVKTVSLHYLGGSLRSCLCFRYEGPSHGANTHDCSVDIDNSLSEKVNVLSHNDF